MRLFVYFSGTVQGVGMRYFIQQTALSYQLTGHVRNLPDGRVEALLEGEENKVQQAIAIMRNGPRAAAIKDIAIEQVENSKHSDGFRITF